MADAHIELTVGDFRLVATGSEGWVDSKYESFLARIEELKETLPKAVLSKARNGSRDLGNTPIGPLAIFLKEKKVGSNQNNRFLATAVWLKFNGQSEPKTSDIIKALAEAQQQRLGNASDVLNKLVKKGYCVKSGAGFYVTPEGEDSLNTSEPTQ
jgi:hypothetical protein